MGLNPKVCLLPLVLGFRMKNIFNLSLVIKLATLATMGNGNWQWTMVLESAGGGDVLEALVYVLLLHVPGVPRVESSTVEQEPLRFEAKSWGRKSAQCTFVGTELNITKKNF